MVSKTKSEDKGEMKLVHESFTNLLFPDTYVYDYRGLRVRSGSTSGEQSKPVQQLLAEEDTQRKPEERESSPLEETAEGEEKGREEGLKGWTGRLDG